MKCRYFHKINEKSRMGINGYFYIKNPLLWEWHFHKPLYDLFERISFKPKNLMKFIRFSYRNYFIIAAYYFLHNRLYIYIYIYMYILMYKIKTKLTLMKTWYGAMKGFRKNPWIILFSGFTSAHSNFCVGKQILSIINNYDYIKYLIIISI